MLQAIMEKMENKQDQIVNFKRGGNYKKEQKMQGSDTYLKKKTLPCFTPIKNLENRRQINGNYFNLKANGRRKMQNKTKANT